MKIILVTGSSGFIGFHLCQKLLDAGHRVIGYDAMTNYYDVSLKRARRDILRQSPNFIDFEDDLENFNALYEVASKYSPEIIVHLAAQAGVRHSIDEPKSYVSSNLFGTFNILEVSRKLNVEHLLIASTSSAYGDNVSMPFQESNRSDYQVSFYAATKRSAEILAHSYSHLYSIPTTVFRFFTVYGPWGRPDMALFKFTKAILNGDSIQVFNNGKMKRDFTFISDLTEAIEKLIPVVPSTNGCVKYKNDSLSPIAPWRIVNIGNARPTELLIFIETLEKVLGKRASKVFMPMQAGDVVDTYADNSLLYQLTGFRPHTNIQLGIEHFVDWYRNYYNSKKTK